MNSKFIQCPKDPENEYLREVCEEVFRKGSVRYWCKNCEIFQKDQKNAEKP